MVSSGDAGSFLSTPRTGILVSDRGLILTVRRVNSPGAPNDPSAVDMLGMQIDDLSVNVSTKEDGDTANGVIIGHDWPRNLVLIKIQEDDVARLGLVPAPAAGFSGKSGGLVCLLGYRDGDPNEATGPLQARSTGDIRWEVDHTADISELGGAVIAPETGALVGIVESRTGNVTRYLPIEFADTLMSQVFIARIIREMENLISISEDVSTAMNWTYQILPNDEPGEYDIRFFFDQDTDRLKFDTVEASTRLWGVDPEGEPGVSVPTDTANAKDDLDVDFELELHRLFGRGAVSMRPQPGIQFYLADPGHSAAEV